MPAKSTHISELALELGLAMSEMKSRLRQKIQSKINEYDSDLSFELIEILGLLSRNNGINQQEIGTQVSKDKSSITYLINNLVKRELVERIENENDRRNKQIFLTSKGQQTIEAIYPLALELYEKAAGDLHKDEINKALILVRKMTANLE
ncbi:MULTISPECIES: MarR family winged helix-turn-helix transcriptional regulator [Chryseobacterium]|jgi:DNA-binding MarR family transcriptional regulator|uniref:MarR family transcriptional regulator n=1 Tax=Chryseobacterium rhizosphaerae TaxID=395937 RepID=A0ABX9IGA2_9FLAO|nr:MULTISPECIES: MarR family transcriptional regulator [Chryseobacterium]MBL3546588.1 MarR family transcriptional regulator [Chryseobacterium sp. KMC2]MDC8099722.1 MarR family transcriptional regulator [Chryseobacterium rhizosphaerae]MDR6547354.1 DNA-binding MarR family transcriptional regulator [Chryseobacterium rhizosphaerae]REC72892.1 MarR family transcriptional regulator [Chryseobacterium rhizosphaerae]SMC99350.1 DNA-binding transcriptional regulator, MarR family [Chryseobacterium sp. YR22